MRRFDLEDGRGTFVFQNKRCLVIRDAGSAETETSFYDIVKEKKDKRGLPILIVKELTLEEAKGNSVVGNTFFDVESGKAIKTYKAAGWTVAKEPCEDVELITRLLEQVNKFGNRTIQKKGFIRQDVSWRRDKEFVNGDFVFEVVFKNGKVSEIKTIEEKFWRGFQAPKEKRITGRYESEDGRRMETETETSWYEGYSDTLISEAEKEEVREEALNNLSGMRYETKRLPVLEHFYNPEYRKFESVQKKLSDELKRSTNILKEEQK